MTRTLVYTADGDKITSGYEIITKDNAQRMMSHTAITKSDCQKTVEMLNQTIEKRILWWRAPLGSKLTFMLGSNSGKILGPRIEARVTSLIYFETADILTLKTMSTVFPLRKHRRSSEATFIWTHCTESNRRYQNITAK